MACCLVDAKPSSEPVLDWTPGNNEISIKIQTFLFKKIHLEMSWKKAAILSRPQWVQLFHMMRQLGSWIRPEMTWTHGMQWRNVLMWPSFKKINTLQTVWWHHQMDTFSTLLALWAGNSPVTGEFPAQIPVNRGFDVFIDLRVKQLSKQSWRWWFETPSRSLWCHCNDRKFYSVEHKITLRCHINHIALCII